jgi:hypothetical protein
LDEGIASIAHQAKWRRFYMGSWSFSIEELPSQVHDTLVKACKLLEGGP